MILCEFCEIAAGRSPASIVYKDEEVIAFMDTRPVRPGTCLLIPRHHVDHFIDIDEQTLQHLMILAKRIGAVMQTEFKPLRVGLVVHGFGVPHAHLILIPQHQTDDITSARFASVLEGRVEFSVSALPEVERYVLDDHARRLRIA